MSALDLGDQLGDFEILSELPGSGRWRVLDQRNGSDQWILHRGPTANQPLAAAEGFTQAQKTLSYLNHPGLLKPVQFYLHDQHIYWVSPLPSATRVTDYLQLHAPVLPKLVSWLAELCSLLEECHHAPQPIFWGGVGLAELRVQESRIQLVGLEMNAAYGLQFSGEKVDARGDVLAVAGLLPEMLGRGSGMAREGYRRNSALRKLMVAATAKDPALRPATLGSLKAQLEKIPRGKPPASLKIGRFNLLLDGYHRYAVPLSLSGLLLCWLLAAGLAQPSGTPPRRLPRSQRARAHPSPAPAARVFLERATRPAPPTARPPEPS